MYIYTCTYMNICMYKLWCICTCTCVPIVGTGTKDDDDDLLDERLNDVDDCYISTQQVSHKFFFISC